MALPLPDDPTSDQLVEFLQRDDPCYNHLFHNWHGNAAEWDRSQIREIRCAAKQNTSIRELHVDAAVLTAAIAATEDTADAVASIIRNFDHIQRFTVVSSTNNELDVPARESHDDARVIDKMLCAMIDSQSSLKDFSLESSGGPQAIIDLFKRFPDIHRFKLGIQRSGCDLTEEFALAVAAAVKHLTALLHVQLCCRGLYLDVNRLLTSLYVASPVLESFTLAIFDDTEMPAQVLKDAGLLLATCKAIETFSLVCCFETEEKLSVSSLLNVPASFSSSLKSLCFENCVFPGIEALSGAARTMKRVTALKLVDCDFTGEEEEGSRMLCLMLERLKMLQKLELLSKFGFPPSALRTNDDLERLTEVVSFHGSLRHVEVDLVNGRGDNQAYPAVQNLLTTYKGSLILNCRVLPWSHTDYICRGIESLNCQLKALSIEFFQCVVDDGDYARFFRLLQKNETLETLLLGFRGIRTLQECATSLLEFLCANKALRKLTFTGMPQELLFSSLAKQVIDGLMQNRVLLHVQFDVLLPLTYLPDAFSSLSQDVLHMLHVNEVIHTLVGLVPFPDEPWAVRSKFLLRQNRYGRRCLDSESVPLGLWPKILAKILADNASDVLFQFLKAKSNLVRCHRKNLYSGVKRLRSSEDLADSSRNLKMTEPR